MGIEGGSSNNEVQNQEINQSTNEQIEQNQAEHQRSGEELEGNSTIDNEGERKQIEGKDDATEYSEDDSSRLDSDDSIENDNNQEQPVENEAVSPEQQQLDNQDTIEGDSSSADGMSENDQEITDSLDAEDSIEDEDLAETDDSEDGEYSLDSEDAIENEEDTEADGENVEDIEADGETAEDTEADGENVEDIEADGENTEDTEADGENAENTEADSEKAEDTEADGENVEDIEADGETAEDTEADGENVEDIEADGENTEDTEADGENAENTEADSEKAEDTEADGEKAEDIEADGENTEDTEADGEKAEDTEADGEKAEDTEADGENAEDTEADSENVEATEADKVREITSPYYEQAGDLARNNEMGRAFTDHKEAHVEMVADKSLEAGDAIKDAVENGNLGKDNGEDRISFSSDIDKKTLEGAALSHDTGMSGNGYALTPAIGEDGKQLKDENGKKMYEKDADGNYVIHSESNDNFNEVRENHSLNSAINVLEKREQYKDAGYTDEQVDKMAAECMAHSKSSSGVADLNSKEEWSDCFDRIDSTVDAYNKDHLDSPISFDRSCFEENDEKLGALASETLALRVGDVSRDSFAGAEAQSGEGVHVDRSTVDNHAGSVAGELENADITIGENGTPIENEKSRQVHAGEQNITGNHTYAGDNGNLTHEITVADGVSAPKCTQEALGDHLGELASARDGEFDVNIEFTEPCDDYARESYEKFRDDAAGKYENVSIHYPWDEEE